MDIEIFPLSGANKGLTSQHEPAATGEPSINLFTFLQLITKMHLLHRKKQVSLINSYLKQPRRAWLLDLLEFHAWGHGLGHQQRNEDGSYPAPISSDEVNSERAHWHALSPTWGSKQLGIVRLHRNSDSKKWAAGKGWHLRSIREGLACYSAGMSTSMTWNFKFVTVSGNAYHDVTQNCMTSEYNINFAVTA